MRLEELALRNLPIGRFVRFQAGLISMSGKPRDAVVWEFRDKEFRDLRRSYFSIWDGEYLGECF